MRCLIVYYSRSGVTRKVAERAAKDLGADVAEIRTPAYRLSGASYLRAAWDSLTGKRPDISVSGPSPDAFDFVLVAAPVWAGHAATPVRAYLARHKGAIKRAAFVLTCGGHTPPKAFAELAADAGVEAESTFVLREKDVASSAALPADLAAYLSSLKMKRAA